MQITILVVTNDIVLVKNLQERSKSLNGEFRYVPLSSGEKFSEYVQKYQPDVVFLDDTLVDPLNGKLVVKLHQLSESEAKGRPPIFALCGERSMKDLKTIMRFGFADVFTKPIDPVFFYQKLQIHLPQRQFLKDRLLFSMDVEASLDLAIECKLVRASEFGATIRLNRELHVGDLFALHGSLFGAQTGSCLGRIMSSAPRQGDGEKFESTLVFVAPTREMLSTIRLWMKQQYVKERENGSEVSNRGA